MSKDVIDIILENQKAQLSSLEAIQCEMKRMNDVQIQQAADIKYHITRTDTLQEMVTPVYKIYMQILGIGKLLGGIAFIGGLVVTFKKIFY